ncbi:PepSY-associated TM helix domain-containing protein [Thermomonas sp.]
MASTIDASRLRPATTYRWVRQLHLWIGAWGALAAILYGITGLVMNHRFGDGAWPQGESSEAGRSALQVPAEARATAEQLSLWLLEARQLDATNIRKGAGKGGGGNQPEKWNLSGGKAGNSWSIEYVPGSDSAELKQSTHSPLAAFNRLHKGVGGGAWWILLADSFAIGMLLLGLSGMWMWARGRSPREMLVSVMGLSTLAFLAVVGLALL